MASLRACLELFLCPVRVCLGAAFMACFFCFYGQFKNLFSYFYG